uniref:AAA+ ATPase domain-containing protein n=1 Tax=Tetranychus urticae TaxID=32264 RepID=A0A158P4B8_TETUR
MKPYFIYLHHPFTMLVAGPTGSGKTRWIMQLIAGANRFSSPPPQKITYFYGEYQSIFGSIKDVNFIKGLPENLIEKFDGTVPEWIIIDDLMSESTNSKIISELFTKGSHHRNLSVILIVQNFFTRGKESRNISLNSQYIVLFKNPRDQSIITSIGRQMLPGKVSKLQAIYEDATAAPYSYLFVDLKPETPMEVRFLSNVLGEKDYITTYLV